MLPGYAHFSQTKEFEQMNETSGRFTDKNLVSRIAWLYFIKGFTQHQISKRLNLSRMQVQRSISKSKKEGLVRIEIIDPGTSCFEIEEQLRTQFSLSDAVVIPAPDEEKLKEELGKAAAGYLLRLIQNNQIIGVGWGTTLQKMTEFIKGKTLENVKVVSLIGGWSERTKESPYEVAWNFADALKAPCYHISAPAVADSLVSHSVITSEKIVSSILNIARASDIAVLGIGSADNDSSLVQAGVLSSDQLKQLRAKGAVGDICAQFYDNQGQPVDHGYMERVIGLSLHDLQKIGTVIGIAGGKQKAAAICGAIKGRLLNVLITDERTAKGVLLCH
jgi:lsr operon transcriptional repressor